MLPGTIKELKHLLLEFSLSFAHIVKGQEWLEKPFLQ